VRSSAYFAKANPPACQELSHLGDPCSCTGVIGCSGGRITSVVLTRKGLAFNATDESSLGLLDGLQHIDVNLNALTGPVPTWLLNLTSLNFLNFYSNHFTGTVPTELGALTGLNYLSFVGNHLTGTVPAELGALTGLNHLCFNNNQLTGTVPALPFKQYTANCCLSWDAHSNKFSCPLPADAAACICVGKPGVACT
jgi:hypothetical protein